MDAFYFDQIGGELASFLWCARFQFHKRSEFLLDEGRISPSSNSIFDARKPAHQAECPSMMVDL